jgi:prolyl-tRNA synthetase
MRTRLFLRTAEFLWQEGHTAHATREEAEVETKLMLDVYSDFVQDILAIPVIKGVKTESERFAGAIDTYCIEALMQDGKALQTGTSHFLGQNFAKAFDVKFTNAAGKQEYVWASSWGVSTRLMGALIMCHSDDNGLVLPPRLAPIQVVLVPIYRKEEERTAMVDACQKLVVELKAVGIRVKLDNDDKKKPGWKFAEYEFKGVPIRLAIGPRDLESGTVELSRRDTLTKESVPLLGLSERLPLLLEEIQQSLFERALEFRNQHITPVETWEEFQSVLKNKGGFISAHWDGSTETEEKIKEATKASIRCIPLNNKPEAGACIFSGKPSSQRVYFALAY